MHVDRRVRIASSVAIRSSSSARQLRESRSQSRFVGVRPVGQRVKGGLDALEWDACLLAGLDQRDSAQRHAGVAALVPARALGRDQALALVEPQG